MTNRFTFFLSLGLLGGAVAAGVALSQRGEPTGVAAQRLAKGVRPDSVAVLPFREPTGLHDGVKWHLGRWVKEVPLLLLEDSTLRVARPRAVAEFPNKKDEIVAGHHLGVAAVLTGEVMVEDDGQRLVVEAELVEVDTGLLLWTKRWEITDIEKKNETLESIRVELAEGVKKRMQAEPRAR